MADSDAKQSEKIRMEFEDEKGDSIALVEVPYGIGIRINVKGHVFTKPLQNWHAIAMAANEDWKLQRRAGILDLAHTYKYSGQYAGDSRIAWERLVAAVDAALGITKDIINGG